MVKKFMIGLLGFMLVGFTGCTIKTPEIRGIVLDDETKQPVEAWVHATLQIRTKTTQGPVISVLRVDPPHTRSGKDGKFMIPAKEFQEASFPMAFGTNIETFTINASTLEDKSDGFYLKDYGGRKQIEVVLRVKPWEKGLSDEREYFSYIQSLFGYCLRGRLGVEIPAVEGGCDEWELDFVITKHKRYLERNRKLAEEGKARGYGAALEQLSDLYERKGDLTMAIEPLKMKIALIEKRGLLKFKEWQSVKEAIEWKIKKFKEKQEQK